MDHDFWLERWRSGQILGFHLQETNPRLLAHWPRIEAERPRRVLVPLCGKSNDLAWLASRPGPDGKPVEVVGVELSREAAVAFFAEHALLPDIVKRGPFECFSHANLTIAVGDFFAATPESLLGTFDAAYDRAALIALPPSMRAEYVAALRRLLAPGAPILLVVMAFDAPGGPPHSIDAQQAREQHAGAEFELLATDDITADLPNLAARGATHVEELTALLRYPLAAI
jgi:thiopurine S-methyltransferase